MIASEGEAGKALCHLVKLLLHNLQLQPGWVGKQQTRDQ